MENVIIDAGKQPDGFTFRLNPKNRIRDSEKTHSPIPKNDLLTLFPVRFKKSGNMLPLPDFLTPSLKNQRTDLFLLIR
jgi:hypothetical protein